MILRSNLIIRTLPLKLVKIAQLNTQIQERPVEGKSSCH